MEMSDVWTAVSVIRGIPASAAGAAMAAAEAASDSAADAAASAAAVTPSDADDLAYILGT